MMDLVAWLMLAASYVFVIASGSRKVVPRDSRRRKA